MWDGELDHFDCYVRKHVHTIVDEGIMLAAHLLALVCGRGCRSCY